jgi:hypothetical protein
MYRRSLSAHLNLIFYQGSPSHCGSSLRFSSFFSRVLCSVALGPAQPLGDCHVGGCFLGARDRRLNLCVYIHCLHRTRSHSQSSPFHLNSRPSSTDDLSRFQEVPVDFVGDVTSTLKAGSRFYVHGAGPHDTGVEESNGKNDNSRAAKMKTKNRNNISSIAGGSTKSLPASTPSAFSSSGASEYSEFYREPDLQMTHANWWQELVAIYHANAEIGNELVMADILHL